MVHWRCSHPPFILPLPSCSPSLSLSPPFSVPDPQNPIKDVHAANRVEDLVAGSNGYDHRFLAAAVSPRIHRKSSGEFMEPTHFLRTCGLCERRLQPGRDIYMYRYSIPTINSHFTSSSSQTPQTHICGSSPTVSSTQTLGFLDGFGHK